ncbi:hypothetical protein EV401DRAFT_1049803 [Pisolithus croceorrhizus]|nr:hypothetical protein EV401DRAFT_1049803 [Pisolithus croceorrhizus]
MDAIYSCHFRKYPRHQRASERRRGFESLVCVSEQPHSRRDLDALTSHLSEQRRRSSVGPSVNWKYDGTVGAYDLLAQSTPCSPGVFLEWKRRMRFLTAVTAESTNAILDHDARRAGQILDTAALQRMSCYWRKQAADGFRACQFKSPSFPHTESSQSIEMFSMA